MGNMRLNKEPKTSQRDPQTLSLFLILGALTVMVLFALRWVLFVPTGPLAPPPPAVESSKSP
jgi:hypothetical protein